MSLKIFLTALSVMATVTLQGKININTNGQLPGVGSVAPDFKAVKADLSEVSLSEFKGKRVVINIFPSIDTGVCAASVRRFNQEASSLDNTVVLCLSRTCLLHRLASVVPKVWTRLSPFQLSAATALRRVMVC